MCALAPATARAIPRADADRVCRALRAGCRDASTCARRGSCRGCCASTTGALRAHLRERRADRCRAARQPRRSGLAVDLGTTNCAGFLVDLETGAALASLGIENPQVAWGADVISRAELRDSRAGRAARTARRRRHRRQRAGARSVPGGGAASTSDIVDVGDLRQHRHASPAARTAGPPARPRAFRCRRCATRIDLKARDLGLALAPGAYVHLAAQRRRLRRRRSRRRAARHRGALGPRRHHARHGHRHQHRNLAHPPRRHHGRCPARRVRRWKADTSRCGMRAAEGAIERVSLAGRPHCHRRSIGRRRAGRPVRLRRARRAGGPARRPSSLNERGQHRRPSHPAVTQSEGDHARRSLAPGVAFTQNDVRAVQLAKAAIRAGIDLLLARQRALDEARASTRVVIAGAFGAYIDVASAIAIGLLPELPLERFAQVGNAAGLGVRMDARLPAGARPRRRARALAAAMSSSARGRTSRNAFSTRSDSNVTPM